MVLVNLLSFELLKKKKTKNNPLHFLKKWYLLGRREDGKNEKGSRESLLVT